MPGPENYGITSAVADDHRVAPVMRFDLQDPDDATQPAGAATGAAAANCFSSSATTSLPPRGRGDNPMRDVIEHVEAHPGECAVEEVAP